MRERPILFSGPMVRAILNGAKTVTRRAARWPLLGPIDGCKRRVYGPDDVAEINASKATLCRYGRSGDRLWVRETWRKDSSHDPDDTLFRADVSEEWERANAGIVTWKPGIHLPRVRARITLDVVNVRVERLHAITEEEAVREGVDAVSVAEVPRNGTLSRRDDFAQIWEKINGRGSWAKNPWVWVISFRRAT